MILVDKIETSAKQHRLLGEKLLLPTTILVHNASEESISDYSNNYFTMVIWCALNKFVYTLVTMVAGRIEVRITRECSSVNCSVARKDRSVVKA